MREFKIRKQVTPRDPFSLDKYLNEIGKIDLLKDEEEVYLAKKIKEGDVKALEKLVNANLRFVFSVAKQYQDQGLSLPDLVNEGNLGLIKAAQRFDETRGFKFISYAIWWIRQSILQSLVNNSRLIRLPSNQVGKKNKMGKAMNEFEQKWEREPTDDELSDILESDISNVKLLRSQEKHFSLDAKVITVRGESEITLLETIKNNEGTLDSQLIKEEFWKIVIGLVRDRFGKDGVDILTNYYGIGCIPKTDLDIAKRFKTSAENIRQRRKRIIALLRRNKELLSEEFFEN